MATSGQERLVRAATKSFELIAHRPRSRGRMTCTRTLASSGGPVACFQGISVPE